VSRAVVGLVAALVVLAPRGVAAQDRLAEARAAAFAGKYEEAIGLYERAVRERGSADAARGLAETLRTVGRYAHAEQVGGTRWGLSNLVGEVRLARGDLAGAAAAFARALERREPDSLRARLNLAVMRLERGDQDSAFREFDRFIDVYNGAGRLTSDELAAVAEGVWRLGQRDPQLFKDALRAFDRAIAADSTNLDAQVRLGVLFLDKYNGAEARATFDAVLRRNPNHPTALLGLARVMRFEGAGDAAEQVRRALAVNPNLVAARVTLSELLLEREAFAEAAAEAERAVAINPTSLEAWTLLAGVRFIAGDSVRFHEARTRAFGLNPTYAEFYARLSDLASRNRLYHRAADLAGQGVGLDATSWRSHALLGVNRLRLGQMAEGRRSLERAFAGDPYDVWTKNTLDLLDVLDRYDMRRVDPVTVVADAREAELLELYVGPLAREAYDSLARHYRHGPAPPIRVELFARHADFSVRTVGLVGLGALGASFGPVLAMDSPSARPPGEFHWGSTLWHELAHTFHLDLSRHRVPRWLSEGLAVYEERRARPGWGMPLDLGFLIALREGKLHRVSELNRGFTAPESPEALGHAYYQAALVCEYLAVGRDPSVFREMLVAYGAGASTEQVFRAVLGTDLADVDTQFERWMRERFASALTVLARHGSGGGGPQSADAVIARARVARDDFVVQLGAGRALLERGDLTAARAALERAAELMPEYAAPDSPLWYLGQVHRRAGDPRRAAQVLGRLVRLNAAHLPALRDLAAVLDSLQDGAGAAAALDAAMFVYPLDPEAHDRLARLASRLGRRDMVVRERRAVVALAPSDRAGAQYELARAYFEAGDLPSARTAVLRALEQAPNYAQAQDLLLAIRAAHVRPNR
jgi:tetratricopeptide (TPR) repeat protein